MGGCVRVGAAAVSTDRQLLEQARDALDATLPMAEEEWGHYPSTCDGGLAIAQMRDTLAAIDAHLSEPQTAAQPVAWRDVLAERHRQINVEGWTPKHDDEHKTGSMALAAACYACNAATWQQHCQSIPSSEYADFSSPGFRWPWAMKWWKPKSQRQDLVRAAALILAEIERLDRLNKAAEPTGDKP